MTVVPGGTFRMGSTGFYREEGPVTAVEVESLWVDDHPVTNAAFRRFVADTGHVTVAETSPDPRDFPGADPSLLVPGSQVFTPHRRAGAASRLDAVVALGARRRLAPPRRTPVHSGREGPPPGGARRPGGRPRLRRLGGQAAADRGRVGARGPRRPGWRHLRVG